MAVEFEGNPDLKLRTPYPLVICGLTVALVSALAGCGTVPDARPQTSSPPSTVTSEAPLAHVGDCRVESSSGLPEEAQTVPCADAHDEEVFLAIPLTDEAYSPEAIEEASAECVGAPFTEFIGLTKAESSLNVYVIAPTNEQWDRVSPRALYCVLFDASGQVSGSLAGSMR